MAEWEWLLHEVKKFLDHILRHTHTQRIILTLRAIPFLFEFMSSTPRATTLNDRWYP